MWITFLHVRVADALHSERDQVCVSPPDVEGSDVQRRHLTPSSIDAVCQRPDIHDLSQQKPVRIRTMEPEQDVRGHVRDLGGGHRDYAGGQDPEEGPDG